MFVTLDQRTPNLGLKYEADSTRNYNWAKLDDHIGRIMDMLSSISGDIPRAIVRNSATQSIPTSTETAVIFNYVGASVGNMFSTTTPDRFTIHESGFYLAGGFAEFESNVSAAGAMRVLSVVENELTGFHAAYSGTAPPAIGSRLGLCVSAAMSLTAGDVIFLSAWHDAGVVHVLHPWAGFWIVRIAA